jgi:hypothetical protein
MDFKLDGYCGLYCGACPGMLATKAGTAGDPCYGCKSEQPAGHCATCGIKACARNKGYEFCDECAELRTCDKMHSFMVDPQWPYHQSVWKNMEMMRQEGLAAWLVAQEERWRCTSCGTSHSWWDETCPSCGQPVANYRADL